MLILVAVYPCVGGSDVFACIDGRGKSLCRLR